MKVQNVIKHLQFPPIVLLDCPNAHFKSNSELSDAVYQSDYCTGCSDVVCPLAIWRWFGKIENFENLIAKDQGNLQLKRIFLINRA